MSARTRIGDTTMDSRDLIEVAKEIEAEDEEDRDDEDQELLAAINALEDEGIEDWQYGAGFIREDYFEDYARQLAVDIGAIDPDASWPLSYIDWKAAADALKMDYTTVEFMGSTYYVR
jgi:hypothetical protein